MSSFHLLQSLSNAQAGTSAADAVKEGRVSTPETQSLAGEESTKDSSNSSKDGDNRGVELGLSDDSIPRTVEVQLDGHVKTSNIAARVSPCFNSKLQENDVANAAERCHHRPSP